MFTIRATRKLQGRLGVKAPEPGLEPTTALGDWYANMLYAERRQLVLCVSDRSLLCAVLQARGMRKNLLEQLCSAVSVLLHDIGVPGDRIAREVEQMAEATIGPTRSRQVLGSMNDIAFNVKHMLGYADVTERQVAMELSGMPCEPLERVFPDRTARFLLGSSSVMSDRGHS